MRDETDVVTDCSLSDICMGRVTSWQSTFKVSAAKILMNLLLVQGRGMVWEVNKGRRDANEALSILARPFTFRS